MAKKAIRPIRIEGNIAYVPLTQGYEAIIDSADVPLVENFNWCALRALTSVYATRTVTRSDGKRRLLRLHTALTGYSLTDHKDGDGLNNRRSNLRLATAAENQRNSRLRAANRSGFKGVSFHKASQKWMAGIKINNRTKHLGRFDTPEEAHAAYVKASVELHGEFGRSY